MGHRFIFFFLFFCVNIQAQKYNKAVILHHDGTQLECLARLPSMYDKTVKFKMDEKGKVQKMKGEDIKSVSYFLRGNNTLELEYLRYTTFFEMNNNRQNLFTSEWIEVLVRGDMTLYYIQDASRSGQRKSFSYHYLVKKEHEKYATEIAYLRYRNGFLIYRMEAEDFFADVPDIEKKIDNREDGYTAKDIVNIVQEYNTLKQAMLNAQ